MNYHGINYEGEANSLKRIEALVTTLKYGDPNEIPNPWITVLVPTYRRVDLLQEALNSILSQWDCDFIWDIVVLDNEPDDGKVNETERALRKLDNKRILYYRNSENVRPADNFNRGLQIARGEWVCFLHDDDLLISNSLKHLGKLIKAYDSIDSKPLGAISAKYYQFTYNPQKKICYADIPELNRYFCSLPFSYSMFHLTHANLWFTAHIGGDVPTNGTTYNRRAALECEGFNDDFGISGDSILFYRMETKYAVYSSLQPLGFYRWGNNEMSQPRSTRRVIKDGYDFREYIYSKSWCSRICGVLLRSCHYKMFSDAVIKAKNLCIAKDKMVRKEDFFLDGVKEPPKLWYFFYDKGLRSLYFSYKGYEARKKAKRAQKHEQELEKESLAILTPKTNRK